MSAPGPSLRSIVSKAVPTWLANVPGFRRLFSLLWTTALLGDELREIAWQGQQAAYPGVGTATAIPYLAASRGLLQGPAESNALFVARLINFRATMRQQGSPESRVRAIQAFLVGQGNLGAGVYPVVRTIDRAGRATTIDASGNVTVTIVTGWDWDELGGWVDASRYHTPAEVDGYWSDLWVLVEDPFTHYTGFSDANWLAAWNTGEQTVDGLCSQAVVAGVESLCETFKGAHTYVRQVVFCADPTTFTPSGYDGNSSRVIVATQTVERWPSIGYWSIEREG